MMINVRMMGYGHLDFKRSVVRKALSRAGILVRKDAKQQLSQKGSGRTYYSAGGAKYKASVKGADPAKYTGRLYRSVRSRLGRGFFAKVAIDSKIAPHAHFVFYGTKHIAARGPVMEDALEDNRAEIERDLANALLDALQPRKI